jgi:hypothetical protein
MTDTPQTFSKERGVSLFIFTRWLKRFCTRFVYTLVGVVRTVEIAIADEEAIAGFRHSNEVGNRDACIILSYTEKYKPVPPKVPHKSVHTPAYGDCKSRKRHDGLSCLALFKQSMG